MGQSWDFKKMQKKKTGLLRLLFWSIFGNHLGPILGSDRPKRGQDEPKRAIRSSKSQKAAFSKTLKNLQFFSVFGSRGLPRESQEAREGSQETPKETPKGGQKLVKKLLKSEAKTEQNEPQTTMAYFQKIALTGGLLAIFEAMGPSKNAYFEDVFKMPQNCSRCLKTVPT